MVGEVGLAEAGGCTAVQLAVSGDRPAVGLVKRCALDVGFGEGRAGRGHTVDERRGALGGHGADEGWDLAVAGLAQDLRRLGVVLAVLAEGLVEAGSELRAAQVAVDVGERDAAVTIGDDQGRSRARPARRRVTGGSRHLRQARVIAKLC
jgi:hypothetical protein